MKKQNYNCKNKLIIITLLVIMVLFIFITHLINPPVSKYAYAEEVSYTTSPMITILTHGLGGSPTDWSNNNFQLGNSVYSEKSHFRDSNFTYYENSIIEGLHNNNTDSEIYILSENKDDINDPYVDHVELTNNTYYYIHKVDCVNYSKPSIIVYNGLRYYDEISEREITDFFDPTNTIYNRFKCAIDTLIDGYKTINGDTVVYPKINLIGHSRGTIINLKYATEYPDRVDSMFALGGLFNGSAILRAIYGVGTGTIER